MIGTSTRLASWNRIQGAMAHPSLLRKIRPRRNSAERERETAPPHSVLLCSIASRLRWSKVKRCPAAFSLSQLDASAWRQVCVCVFSSFNAAWVRKTGIAFFPQLAGSLEARVGGTSRWHSGFYFFFFLQMTILIALPVCSMHVPCSTRILISCFTSSSPVGKSLALPARRGTDTVNGFPWMKAWTRYPLRGLLVKAGKME